MRLLIKIWQINEYGNLRARLLAHADFRAREQANKKHTRPSTPTHAPHEKQEARTRMELTEKRDTARRSQKGTRDRCHCGFAFRAF